MFFLLNRLKTNFFGLTQSTIAHTITHPTMDLDCAFCRELATQDAVQTPCGHLFCGDCWATHQAPKKMNTKCPVCREVVKSADTVGAFLKRHLRVLTVEEKTEKKLVDGPLSLYRSWEVVPLIVMDLQNLCTRCPKVVRMDDIYLSMQQIKDLKKKAPDTTFVYRTSGIYRAEPREVYKAKVDSFQAHCSITAGGILDVQTQMADFLGDLQIVLRSSRPVKHVEVEWKEGRPKIYCRSGERQTAKTFMKPCSQLEYREAFHGKKIHAQWTVSANHIRRDELYDLCRVKLRSVCPEDLIQNQFYWELTALQYTLSKAVMAELHPRGRYRNRLATLIITEAGAHMFQYGVMQGEFKQTVIPTTYDPAEFVKHLRKQQGQILLHPNHLRGYIQVSADMAQMADMGIARYLEDEDSDEDSDVNEISYIEDYDSDEEEVYPTRIFRRHSIRHLLRFY